MGNPWDEDPVADKRRAEDAVEASINFECIKSHWRQSKDGMVLSLVVTDPPPNIVLAPIGQRFMCVLVPIDDHEQPIIPAEVREARDHVRLAGIICKDIEFHQWLLDNERIDALSEEQATEFVRDFCGVASRSEFKTKPDALKKWKILHSAYVSGGHI